MEDPPACAPGRPPPSHVRAGASPRRAHRPLLADGRRTAGDDLDRCRPRDEGRSRTLIGEGNREECSRRDLNPCQKLERLLSLTGLDYGSARGASPDLLIKLPSARADGTVFKAQLSLALLWNSSTVRRAITSGSSRGSSGRDAIRAVRTRGSSRFRIRGNTTWGSVLVLAGRAFSSFRRGSTPPRG